MGILEPISEASPVGKDFKNEDEYLEVEVEIEKSFNVASESKIDWMFVIVRCEKILGNDVKDLKIASFWLYGQWQLNGWSAFIDAFETYASLLTQYNKTLFPVAGRRKVKILEWVEKVFETSLLTATDQFSEVQLTTLLTIFTDLDQTIPLAVETEYRFLKAVHEKCDSLLANLRYKQEEQARQAELDNIAHAKRREEENAHTEAQNIRRSEEEEIIAKFATSSSTSTAITTESETSLSHEDMQETKDPLLEICTTLFEKSPSDYLAFKMLFSLGTTLLEETLNNSQIESDEFIPSEDICTAVRTLADTEVSFTQLLALEEQLLLRPTWLEGYYMATKILYKLGKTEDAEKLEALLFYFLHRHPTFMDFTMKNGKLVPEKMKNWAQTKMLSLCDEGGSAIKYQRAYQEVIALKKEQNEQNALTLLEEYYKKASGDEERFRWRLLFVDFALEIGDKRLALALLLELEKQIDAYQVDQWQPELAITTYEMLLKPIITQELGADAKERIYKKLSILDIQKVINL